jgi:hypothetical protein
LLVRRSPSPALGCLAAGTTPTRRDFLQRTYSTAITTSTAGPAPMGCRRSLGAAQPPATAILLHRDLSSAGSRSAVLPTLPDFTESTCCKRMFQVFQMLQWFVHVCCKCLFTMFHMFFGRMLQVCLSRCCMCFIHMLQVFYLDVAYVLQWFSSVFLKVF